MQIADFIIGLSGHLWLHFHYVWLAISIQTKEADNKKTFPAQGIKRMFMDYETHQQDMDK